MQRKLFWAIAIFAILVFITIPLAAVVWADEDEDDNDDDDKDSYRQHRDYRRVWQKLEDGVWLVYRSKVPKEIVAKYGLKTEGNCPETSTCATCIDDIEFVYTLEGVAAAELSGHTGYTFNGKLHLVPTRITGAPTPEPPDPPVPPEPEWEPSKENLKDDFSCAKCHDGEDATKDKFQRVKWNPNSSGELHKKHSKTCTKCHVEDK